MDGGRNAGVQDAIEAVEALSEEEQQVVVDVVQKRLIEHRRSEIARNATELTHEVREGKASYGAVADLKKDLLEEE